MNLTGVGGSTLVILVSFLADLVRSTLLQPGVQGAPTGKIRGLLTESMFKGKVPRYLGHQKSNESLSTDHVRNLKILED